MVCSSRSRPASLIQAYLALRESAKRAFQLATSGALMTKPGILKFWMEELRLAQTACKHLIHPLSFLSSPLCQSGCRLSPDPSTSSCGAAGLLCCGLVPSTPFTMSSQTRDWLPGVSRPPSSGRSLTLTLVCILLLMVLEYLLTMVNRYHWSRRPRKG